jgi:hypothetical protein
MVEIIEEINEVVIEDEDTGYEVVVETVETELIISSEGSPGPKGDTPTLSDTQILQDASQGKSTPNYDDTVQDKLLSISYEDANGATEHIKVFNYGTVFGEEVVTSIVSTFTYEGQVWEYTKTLNYIELDSAPLWNGTTPTITKT